LPSEQVVLIAGLWVLMCAGLHYRRVPQLCAQKRSTLADVTDMKAAAHSPWWRHGRRCRWWLLLATHCLPCTHCVR
jgi:hypothetical protein